MTRLEQWLFIIAFIAFTEFGFILLLWTMLRTEKWAKEFWKEKYSDLLKSTLGGYFGNSQAQQLSRPQNGVLNNQTINDYKRS